MIRRTGSVHPGCSVMIVGGTWLEVTKVRRLSRTFAGRVIATKNIESDEDYSHVPMEDILQCWEEFWDEDQEG